MGTPDAAVSLEQYATAVLAVIAVRGEGVGIPTAELSRLFERFYRGTNVTGHTHGTGVGLAGSRQIVEQHGGTITVESDEGLGSTFTVRLPLAAANATSDRHAETGEEETTREDGQGSWMV